MRRPGKPIWTDPCPPCDARWEAALLPSAPWWRDGLEESAFDRRAALAVLFLGAGPLSLPGCAFLDGYVQGDEVGEPSLDLQRRTGWNVGATSDELALPGAIELDADGTRAWQAVMGELAWRMAPAQARLLPWYVPTLFQSVADPSSSELRADLRPIYTSEMQRAFDVGRALLALFRLAGSGGGIPTDTLVVVDLPGSQSVAMAAALGEQFDPVFQFDNWPHPRGVVPSQEAIGAALFYGPFLERTRAARPLPAPMALVLDSHRLDAYDDEPDLFDNRYLARLPDAGALRQLGVAHILYVSEHGGYELDDLNADFVDLAGAGIEVRQVALSDFDAPNPFDDSDQRFAEETAPDAPGDGGVPLDDYDEWIWSAYLPLYWGGSRIHHACFWEHYRWYRCHLGRHRIPLARPLAVRALAQGWEYHPQLRNTGFAAPRAGIGIHLRARPAGFGFTHRFGGLRGGSFGRGGWSGFGG